MDKTLIHRHLFLPLYTYSSKTKKIIRYGDDWEFQASEDSFREVSKRRLLRTLPDLKQANLYWLQILEQQARSVLYDPSQL